MVDLETKFDEQILQKYRWLLFPQIANGVITGYNVYADRIISDSPIIVNYLHSDLGFNEDGTPLRHRKELIERLSEIAQLSIKERVVNSVVDRVAVYKIGDWDENPAGLIFYDSVGDRLLPNSLRKYKGLIIAEGKQYDLTIELECSTLLREVLAIFNKYAYSHNINSKGQIQDEENLSAIFGAWKIPLIVVTSNDNIKRKDYKRIFDLVILDSKYEVSTLLRQQRILFENYLTEKDIKFRRIKKICK